MSNINLQLLSHGSRTPSHRCSAALVTLDPAARQLPASPARSSFSSVPALTFQRRQGRQPSLPVKLPFYPRNASVLFSFYLPRRKMQREDGKPSFSQEEGITRISVKESSVGCPKPVPQQPDTEEFLPALLRAKANDGRTQKHSLAVICGCLSCKE